MRAKRLAMFGVLAALLSPACSAQTGALGVDVNADVDAFGHAQMDSAALHDFAARSTVYALPLSNLPPVRARLRSPAGRTSTATARLPWKTRQTRAAAGLSAGRGPEKR